MEEETNQEIRQGQQGISAKMEILSTARVIPATSTISAATGATPGLW